MPESFFGQLLSDVWPIFDLISKRYGALPHELLRLNASDLGFDYAVASKAMAAELKAIKKAREEAGLPPLDEKTADVRETLKTLLGPEKI